MKIGIPKEVLAGETRVAVVPAMIAPLKKNKHEVFVEAGAGSVASFLDDEYQQAGATIVKNGVELYSSSEVVLKFQPPRLHPKAGKHELELMPEGATLICFMEPHVYPEAIRKLVERKITCFAMDYIPRITRAQSMEALGMIATVADCKSVIDSSALSEPL
ncbi:hypothetical protein L0337_28945 [candidate division KSB1 bacterium]|nr:hypothetical protein [candidate division KSB1 bacterium]